VQWRRTLRHQYKVTTYDTDHNHHTSNLAEHTDFCPVRLAIQGMTHPHRCSGQATVGAWVCAVRSFLKKFTPIMGRDVHYRVHKSPLLDPILSQTNPVRNLSPHFCKIHFNIILSSMPTSSKRLLSFRVSYQNVPGFLSCSCYMPLPRHRPWSDHSNTTSRGVQLMKLKMQFPPAACYFRPPTFEYSPQHPVLKYHQVCVLP
jgi:hypothetical protein